MVDPINPPRIKGGWKKFSKGCIIPQRYVLTIMAFLGIVLTYATRISFSVAINRVVKLTDKLDQEEYSVCPMKNRTRVNILSATYHWTTLEKSWTVQSMMYGYILTHVPGGILAEYYGGKHIFGACLLLSGINLLVTPLVIKYTEWKGLIVLRVIIGLSQGAIFPAISILLANWVPLRERSTLATITLSAVQFGSVVGNGLSGWLIETTQRWESVFYTFGFVTIIWYCCWILLAYSFPYTHPYISDKEFYYLKSEIEFGKPRKPLRHIPWAGMFTNVPLLVLILACAGHDYAHFTLAMALPLYFDEVLQVNITKNGVYSAVPYIARFFLGLFGAIIGDYLIAKNKMGITAVRKLWTGFNTYVPAVFIVLAGYNDCNEKYALAMFIVTLGFMGFYYPGLRVNCIDISPHYAGTMMALVNGTAITAGIAGLATVTYVKHSLKGWIIVFWICCISRVIPGTMYLIWGSAEIQDFDHEDYVFPGCCKKTVKDKEAEK